MLLRIFAMTSVLAGAVAVPAARAENNAPFEIQLPECPPPVARVHMYPPYTGKLEQLVIKTDADVITKRDASGDWIFQRNGEQFPATLSVSEATRVATIYASNVKLKRDPDGTAIMLLYSPVSTPCKIVGAYGTTIVTPAPAVPTP